MLPSIMLTLLLLLTLLYASLVLLCALALAVGRWPVDPSFRPRVSIIIAARNEEAALPACLDALSRLTYPRSLLEVVVVDDGSTDGTAAILREYAGRHPFLRQLSAPQDGPLLGKVNALASGIEASCGEILLFTDADCLVPAGWVEETVQSYVDKRVGLVAGFTVLSGKSWYAQIQALDWMVLFSLASAALRLRFPVTAVGNNLSVRRAAYDAVGGYRTIPFSVTEDFALFRAVTGAGWSARFPLHAGAVVVSAPCASLRQMIGQKKRWFLGGTAMTGLRRVLFGIAYLFFGVLVVAGFSGEVQPVVAALAVKTAADTCLVLPLLRSVGRPALLGMLPLYQLYVLATTLVFPPVVLLHPGVVWKGRTLNNDKAPR